MKKRLGSRRCRNGKDFINDQMAQKFQHFKISNFVKNEIENGEDKKAVMEIQWGGV